MAQTLVTLLVHVVFSTKNRIDLIPADEEIEGQLFAYIGGILKSRGNQLLAAGCTQNHIHLLISLSKNERLSELMRDVKTSTSKWMKTTAGPHQIFQWQDGYGAFSIGASQISAVRTYLKSQKEHHQTRTFEDEYLVLLRKYEMDYDPNYLWG